MLIRSVNANVKKIKERTHQSNQHVHSLAFESLAILRCVRSLLFFTLAFNDSNKHVRIDVCEITFVLQKHET